MSALERLRRATRFHQCVTDADRLALVGKSPNLAAYVGYLTKMYGFETPLESALSLRLDSARLGIELGALGYPMSNVAVLPQCALPALDGEAEALGWQFVSEANRSGHQMFRTYLSRSLPAVLRGSAILIAPVMSADVQQLEAKLDRMQLEPVIEAATRAFDCLHAWMRPDTPSGSTAQKALRARP